MSTTASVRRRARLGAGVTAAAMLALIALPGVALATIPPTEAPPDADAQCETVPTSYPGNGIPVPDGASCAVVTTAAGAPAAEVWAWGDAGGLHWYNYLAEGFTGASGSLLTMCATQDESADGVVYECTTDSYYLLFTMSSLFVTWPSAIEPDHYFCESVDVVGPDYLPVTAYACGAVSAISDDGDAAPEPPVTTTPPPVSTPPPATQPPVAPTTDPPDQTTNEPVDPAEPSTEPPASVDVPRPTTTAPTPSAWTGPGAPHGLPEAEGPGPAATPVDSQSVALVGGAAFPVALVFMLAGALALGGIGVLAGPSALAAFRRKI
jgi:hypothetical protein